MSNNVCTVVITSTDNAALASSPNLNATNDAAYAIKEVAGYVQSIGNGAVRGGGGNLVISTNAVASSATATAASVANGDTITIGGVVLTAATETQDSTHFLIGSVTNTVAAANLVKTILANTTLQKLVTASSAAAVATISCIVPGLIGNQVTLVSSNGTRLAVTGSGYLASGAQDAPVVLSQGL
jgi:hypothetical protein